jgi:hypothetical protein
LFGVGFFKKDGFNEETSHARNRAGLSAVRAGFWASSADLTGNFKHFLGITGDFSGGYTSRRTSSTVYTYTVGPVLTARLPVVQPFVHALFGGATITGGGVSDNAFAMMVGGGLDIGLRKGIGLRLIQADWLMTQFGGQTQERQGRASAGLVIKF